MNEEKKQEKNCPTNTSRHSYYMMCTSSYFARCGRWTMFKEKKERKAPELKCLLMTRARLVRRARWSSS